MLLRYLGGVRGMLWASQVAPAAATILGSQFSRHMLERGSPEAGDLPYTTRLPSHHPEGYLEAFAQLYTDAAERIRAHDEHRAPDRLAALAPGIGAGIEGMRFISGAVAATRLGGWIPRDKWTMS